MKANASGIAALLIACAGPVSAVQDPAGAVVRLEPPAACDSCVLRMTLEATLVASGKPSPSEVGGVVVRDGGGRYHHAPAADSGAIVVFDSAGNALPGTGRPAGAGPIGAVTDLIVTAGDTLYVFDRSRNRVTVLTPSYRVARSFTIAGDVHSIGVLGPEKLVVNAEVPGRNGFDNPLHIVEGRWIARSFGAMDELGNAGASFGARRSRVDSTAALRHLAVAGNGRFWAAHADAYVIDLYSEAGRLLQRFTARRDWLPARDDAPFDRRERFAGPEPPTPRLLDIQWDPASGLLWLLGRGADPKWNERLLLGRPREPGRNVITPDVTYDTVVEVVDPASHRIVASMRIDEYPAWLVGPGRLAVYRANAAAPAVFRMTAPALAAR